MKLNEIITIKLSGSDIKEIIEEFLKTKGYKDLIDIDYEVQGNNSRPTNILSAKLTVTR